MQAPRTKWPVEGQGQAQPSSSVGDVGCSPRPSWTALWHWVPGLSSKAVLHSARPNGRPVECSPAGSNQREMHGWQTGTQGGATQRERTCITGAFRYSFPTFSLCWICSSFVCVRPRDGGGDSLRADNRQQTISIFQHWPWLLSAIAPARLDRSPARTIDGRKQHRGG